MNARVVDWRRHRDCVGSAMTFTGSRARCVCGTTWIMATNGWQLIGATSR